MSDPRDLLDEWQELADEATPGPWELGAAWSYVTPDTTTGHHATDCPACGHGVRVELSAEDAGFILASRTAVPALVAAARAVLDLHQPVDSGCLCCRACTCGHWSHAECPTVRALADRIGGAA